MPLPRQAADATLVQVDAYLREQGVILESAILATPTGARRNFLTDANIHLMKARSDLSAAMAVTGGTADDEHGLPYWTEADGTKRPIKASSVIGSALAHPQAAMAVGSDQ